MSIALKFTSLFLRTLAKPIANQIKTQAREHPSFRRKCILVAQSIHKTEVTLRRHLLNEGDKKVRPLNDARAIQTGANFVAESFVFSVAGALILYESWRSRRKELKRQASVADDIKFLQDEIVWIKEKLKQSTIIKQGEEIPVPKDLKPLVLKWINEETPAPGAVEAAATTRSGGASTHGSASDSGVSNSGGAAPINKMAAIQNSNEKAS